MYWDGRWEGLGMMGLVAVRVACFFEYCTLLHYCLTIENVSLEHGNL